MEDTLRVVATNRYLGAVLALCHRHMALGCGGVDAIDEMTAGVDVAAVQEDLLDWLDAMALEDKHATIPYLRRLGFSVARFDDVQCPMSILFPGNGCAHCYEMSTSPGLVRMRGVVWCVSRLLAWRWRAAERAYMPGGSAVKRLCREWGEMLTEREEVVSA